MADEKQEAVRAAMPGLPSQVVQMVQSAPADTCGSCAAFNGGRCSYRNVLVAPLDPGCDFYESDEVS